MSLCVSPPDLSSYASTLSHGVGTIYAVSSLDTLCLGAEIIAVLISIGLTTFVILVAFDLNIFARLAKEDWCRSLILGKRECWCGAWGVCSIVSSVWMVASEESIVGHLNSLGKISK